VHRLRAAAAEATDAVLRLKYLGGGHGDGCNNEDDASRFLAGLSHFTFYGFMLCFSATSVATLYHYVLLGRAVQLPSLPKLWAWPGGVSLIVGTVGLWRLNRQTLPLHGDLNAKADGLGFIALLFLTSASAWPCGWSGARQR